jgi:hypothetical protein
MSDGSADVDVPSNRRPTRTLSTTRRGAGIEAITKEVLSARTGAYGWNYPFARNDRYSGAEGDLCFRGGALRPFG